MNTNLAHMPTSLIQIILVFTAVSLVYGSELPNDARLLLEKRDEAVKVIDRRLVEELEKIKVAHTKRGDLDSANAIVAIIKKYNTNEGIQKDPSAQFSRLEGSWKRDADGTTFIIDSKGGGVHIHNGSTKFSVTYNRAMDHYELYAKEWGAINIIKFTADENTLTGSSAKGMPYILTRIK